MSNPTFYIPPEQIAGSQATLTGDELRHARLTLRLGTGDSVKIVDGEGASWNALIKSMDKEKSTLTLSDKKVELIPSFKLTIAMGIVPGDRFDWAIQKGTELGAADFIPLLTERTELKIRGYWKRLDRLKRVIVSTCKQCGRSRFPTISEPVLLKELKTDPYDLSVVFWEEKTARHLKEVTEGIEPPGSVLMVIGPVGGLTADEVELLKDKGFKVAGMGQMVLRTETAVTVGAALLQFMWGDMS